MGRVWDMVRVERTKGCWMAERGACDLVLSDMGALVPVPPGRLGPDTNRCQLQMHEIQYNVASAYKYMTHIVANDLPKSTETTISTPTYS